MSGYDFDDTQETAPEAEAPTEDANPSLAPPAEFANGFDIDETNPFATAGGSNSEVKSFYDQPADAQQQGKAQDAGQDSLNGTQVVSPFSVSFLFAARRRVMHKSNTASKGRPLSSGRRRTMSCVPVSFAAAAFSGKPPGPPPSLLTR